MIGLGLFKSGTRTLPIGTVLAYESDDAAALKAAELEKSALELEARNNTERAAVESEIPVVIEDAGAAQQAVAEVWEEGAAETKRINEIRNLRKSHPSKPQIKKLCAYSFAGIADLDRVVAELPPKSKFHTVESTLVDGSYRGIMLKKVHGEWQLVVERYEQEAFKLAVQEQLHPKEVEPQPKHIVRSYGYVRQKVRPLTTPKPSRRSQSFTVELVGGPLLRSLRDTMAGFRSGLDTQALTEERLALVKSLTDNMLKEFDALLERDAARKAKRVVAAPPSSAE